MGRFDDLILILAGPFWLLCGSRAWKQGGWQGPGSGLVDVIVGTGPAAITVEAGGGF